MCMCVHVCTRVHVYAQIGQRMAYDVGYLSQLLSSLMFEIVSLKDPDLTDLSDWLVRMPQ